MMGVFVPPEYAIPEWTQAQYLELWQQVVLELSKSEYRNRTHGNRRTYDAGCTGPICRKASREYARRRASRAASDKYKYIDPLIDYFKVVAEVKIKNYEANMLRELAGL